MSADPVVSPIRFAMLSSVGRVRSGNEDFCAASTDRRAFIVCDGMGGAAAGEVASNLAATTFLNHLRAAFATAEMALMLHEAAAVANRAVFEQSEQTPSLHGMGTTLVALIAEPAGGTAASRLWLVHIGDSRCYRLRGGILTRLTEDHSLVQEQIRAGQITAEQAEISPVRNIITRAVGAGPEVEADVLPLTTEPGDLYLLASDGLTREVSDTEIEAHLKAGDDLDALCTTLVAAANDAGGHDNVTVLLLSVD